MIVPGQHAVFLCPALSPVFTPSLIPLTLLPPSLSLSLVLLLSLSPLSLSSLHASPSPSLCRRSSTVLCPAVQVVKPGLQPGDLLLFHSVMHGTAAWHTEWERRSVPPRRQPPLENAIRSRQRFLPHPSSRCAWCPHQPSGGWADLTTPDAFRSVVQFYAAGDAVIRSPTHSDGGFPHWNGGPRVTARSRAEGAEARAAARL